MAQGLSWKAFDQKELCTTWNFCAGQSNFTFTRKDDSEHVSQALEEVCNAMQAGEHGQACMNASQRAAKQPQPQPQQQQPQQQLDQRQQQRRHLQMPLAVQRQLRQQK
jgi:hypothetical protein